MALKGHILSIADADQVQFSIIKSWNLMKWDKQTKSLMGKPYPNIAEYYEKLRKTREAVDKERLSENPIPIYKPPVKSTLYKHQTRGYNMALLTFNWAEPL